MNSAIQQKANEITSSVSETYTTKTDFNNLSIGGTNLQRYSKAYLLKGANPSNYWNISNINIYSIYNKLTTGKKWSDIYDILAMRLILPTKDDCYLAVGLIHAKYRPIPKRFKDYIAMPKENMYQSLHTSVFGVDGHIFEIQLRTKEMDEIAEAFGESNRTAAQKAYDTVAITGK